MGEVLARNVSNRARESGCDTSLDRGPGMGQPRGIVTDEPVGSPAPQPRDSGPSAELRAGDAAPHQHGNKASTPVIGRRRGLYRRAGTLPASRHGGLYRSTGTGTLPARGSRTLAENQQRELRRYWHPCAPHRKRRPIPRQRGLYRRAALNPPVVRVGYLSQGLYRRPRSVREHLSHMPVGDFTDRTGDFTVVELVEVLKQFNAVSGIVPGTLPALPNKAPLISFLIA